MFLDKDLKEELDQIDKFFENMSINEFENMLERCGINDITCASEKDMELISNLKNSDTEKPLYKNLEKVNFRNTDLYMYENDRIKVA